MAADSTPYGVPADKVQAAPGTPAWPRLNRDSVEALKMVDRFAATEAAVSADVTQSADGEDKFGSPLVDQAEASIEGEMAGQDTDVGPGRTYSGSSVDNPKFRQTVEEQSEALDFSKYAYNYCVYQWVVIYPGKLEVQMRTQSGDEAIWIGKRPSPTSMPQLYELRLEDLAVSLRAGRGKFITGSDDPEVVVTFDDPLKENDSGELELDEGILLSNIKRVRRMNNQLLNILLPQLWWFMARVDEAMGPKNLGNS